MLTLDKGMRYYFCIDSVSFRNRIRGLSSYVRGVLGSDPKDGSVFIFLGRSRKELRLLHYDGDGYELYSKRLDPGTRYRRPVFNASTGKYEIGWEDLLVLAGGVVMEEMRFP